MHHAAHREHAPVRHGAAITHSSGPAQAQAGFPPPLPPSSYYHHQQQHALEADDAELSSPVSPQRRTSHQAQEQGHEGEGGDAMYYPMHQQQQQSQHSQQQQQHQQLGGGGGGSTSTFTLGRMAAPAQQYSAAPLPTPTTGSSSSSGSALYDHQNAYGASQQGYYSNAHGTPTFTHSQTQAQSQSHELTPAHSPVSPVFPNSIPGSGPSYAHHQQRHGQHHGHLQPDYGASPVPPHAHVQYSSPIPQAHTSMSSSSLAAAAPNPHSHQHQHSHPIPAPHSQQPHVSDSMPSPPPPHANITSTSTSNSARRLNYSESDIGSYVTFATGPFAGRTVRAELVEIQKADLGRKCADPPTGASGGGGGNGGNARVGTGSNNNNSSSANNADRTPTSASTDGDPSSTARSRASRVRDQALGRADTGSRGSDDGNGGDDSDQEKDKNAPPVRNVRKDRRPLDPPPVVKLRFYEALEYGTTRQYEREVPAEDIAIGGLICDMDLFRVTIPPSPLELQHMGLGAAGPVGPGFAQDPVAASARLVSLSANMNSASGVGASNVGAVQMYGQYPGSGQAFYHAGAGQRGSEDVQSSQSPISPVRRVSGYGPGAGGRDEWEGAQNQVQSAGGTSGGSPTMTSPASAGGYAYPPILQSAQHGHGHASATAAIDVDSLPPPRPEDLASSALFGQKYTHAASILDMQGRNAIIFVFSDISVKLEGLFRPRYRFFDLFSRTAQSQDVHVLAEALGGVFAVYSTKEFPGLRASTPLTKHLSRWGIHVNIRETERRRRAGARGGGGGGGGARGGRGGRRGGATGDDADEDADGLDDGDGASASAGSVGAGPSTSASRTGGGSSGARRPAKRARRGSASTVTASGSGSGLRGLAGGSGGGSGSGVAGGDVEVDAPRSYLANAVAVAGGGRRGARGR